MVDADTEAITATRASSRKDMVCFAVDDLAFNLEVW